MSKEYEKSFKLLNARQREAVEAIDGPILVVAGPGTGKTQLIGTRVGYILANQDIEPSNILLLTFTDAAVAEMRKRLERLVPAQAHKVNIYTYHGFANDLIRNNPEYFEGYENEPVDELASATILTDIIEALPYGNPMKSAAFYKGQVLGFISDAKRALLKPEDIEAVAKANLAFIKSASSKCRKHLDKLDRISKQSVPVLKELQRELNHLPDPAAKLPVGIKPLREAMSDTLFEALAEAATSGKTVPLTAWKNQWLAKDDQGRFIIAGQKQNERLLAAADVYRQYQAKLAAERAYDYDDMIIRAIEVLEADPDFKYSQAEHYQYLMLDEFQDTNAAQLRLIELLTDAPVYEGRPNVLAVGDDDQAIYAFQGADHANMLAFTKLYKDVKVIPLKQNYRSRQRLVEMAAGIAGQIETRLHHSFEGISKTLEAAGKDAKRPPKLEAREFATDAAQYGWIAGKIKKLIKAGTPASEIAVLAPKHKYLEQLLPYLSRLKLPVAYEKREDILEDPKVLMLTQMARLTLALAEGHEQLADHLWPEVLSYEFWGIPAEVIWQIVWDTKGGAQDGKPLTPRVLKDPATKTAGQFFMKLKDCSRTASLEEMLDALIGIDQMHEQLSLPSRSPYFEHYFIGKLEQAEPQAFTDLLSNLNLLRARLRNRQRRQEHTTHLSDLINFVDENVEADINVLNTSPYHQNQEAVNLLTAYGAKGREFKAVFVMGVQSEIWGQASRSRGSSIKLPANLEHITYAGMSDDERLRLFYVAITRAKTHLYLTSYVQTLDGQRQRHLEYLGIARGEDDVLTAAVMPEKFNRVIVEEGKQIEPQFIEDYWKTRHLPGFKPKLEQLLASRLAEYKLSATHLNKFIDVETAGPDVFFIYYLLGFPQAPTETTAFGTAMHATLAYAGNYLNKQGRLPSVKASISYLEQQLAGGWLRAEERQRLIERGRKAVPVWLKQVGPLLRPSDKYEKNFRSEGVLVGQARLTGKIDRVVVDPKRREITVVDIKTGAGWTKWPSTTKAHKFKQQLMFYKLLVEGSNSFRGYQVKRGVIEFAEPEGGKIQSSSLEFDDAEMAEFKRLVAAVWRAAMKLELPEVSGYPRSLRGIKLFEQELLK